MSKILALDQASKTTGYSVWDDSKMLAQGKFSYDNPDVGQRLHDVKLHVLALLKAYQIEKLYLEDIQLEEKFGVVTYKILAELIGVLQELAIENQIPVEIVPSATWRSTCGVRGKNREDKKANAQKHVLEKYGLKVSEDEADAICIGSYMVEKYMKNNEMIEFSSL